mgnify:CR=1 FL=1
MIRKRNIALILCSFSIALCGIGTAFGETVASVVNNFNTGIVDIDLQQYEIVNGEEVESSGVTEVMPGRQVSRIARITNEAYDCYVRAKVAFSKEDLSEEDLYGISDDWVRKDDGYYYYTKVLKTDESTDLFEGVSIPTDFSQELEEQRLNLDVNVDAIQSRNFNPNFNNGNPWGDVEILERKQGDYEMSQFKMNEDSNVFTVEYKGASEGLVINKDDFFSDFTTMMPGDVLEHDIELKNTGDNKIDLYFNTETVDDSELLDAIQLQISVDGKEIYNGSINAEELNDKIKLGNYGDGKMSFKVTVPAELNNHYSLLDSKVKWVFSADEQEPEGGISQVIDKINPVKTGDPTVIAGWIVLLVGSAVACGVIVKKRRK